MVKENEKPSRWVSRWPLRRQVLHSLLVLCSPHSHTWCITHTHTHTAYQFSYTHARIHRLSSELDMIHEKKVIVFVNTKRQCDNVYAQLEEAGYSCTVLHGGRNQDQREVCGARRLGAMVSWGRTMRALLLGAAWQLRVVCAEAAGHGHSTRICSRCLPPHAPTAHHTQPGVHQGLQGRHLQRALSHARMHTHVHTLFCTFARHTHEHRCPSRASRTTPTTC
jgi:hypothetical protein